MKALKYITTLFFCLFIQHPVTKADEYILQSSGGFVSVYGNINYCTYPPGSNSFQYQSNKFYLDIQSNKLVQLNVITDLEGADYVNIYDIDQQGNQRFLGTINGLGGNDFTSLSRSGKMMVELVAYNDGIYDNYWYDYYTYGYAYGNPYYNGLCVNFSESQNGQVEDALTSRNMILNKGMFVDGRIGIGTLNPDEAVTVKGKMHVMGGVSVVVSAPADYVFDPNYSLKKIFDVEHYVKQNSHLPDIPSAKEIVKGGLKMGDMQNKLLQKIEELTLYIIQQQKEIDQLESQLSKKP